MTIDKYKYIVKNTSRENDTMKLMSILLPRGKLLTGFYLEGIDLGTHKYH